MRWGRLCVVTAAVMLIMTEVGYTAKKPGKAVPQLVGRLLNVEKCRDKPSAMSNFTATLRQIGKSGLIGVDMDYLVERDAQSLSKVVFHMVKCREAISSNTCEYYQHWSYSVGVCYLLTAENVPWQNAVEKLEPPWKCPFKKGWYHIRNNTVNLESMKSSPFMPPQFDGNIWRTSLWFLDQNKEVFMCFTADVDFVRPRNTRN